MLNVQQDERVIQLLMEAWPLVPTRYRETGRVARDVPGGPLNWLLPDVARVIREHQDESPADFASRVRCFVEDHAFLDASGGWLRDERRSDCVQRLIQTATKVHRVLHRDEATPGWHHLPSPPEMFG